LPKLSIIIPCYNSESYIGKTIQSVINQLYSSWELIVVNDGSTDNSVLEVSRYLSVDSRIKLFTIENSGVNNARNFGFSKSSCHSEYIHFLDSDDIISPNFYQRLTKFLDDNLQFGAVYSNHIFINEIDQKIETPKWGDRFIPTQFWMNKVPENTIETSPISIALWCKISESMTVIRRSIYENSKKWDPTFKYGLGGEGVVLFFELSLISKIAYIDEILYNYRRHDSQSSQNNKENSNAFLNTTYKINAILNNKSDSILFLSCISRYRAMVESAKLKHNLRYDKMKFIKGCLLFVFYYSLSIPITIKTPKLLY
jgi:glycosyltransferase involved in cell wall biosynthesis